uniref:HIG1 domain-containing protein n=1 Tax=Quercus lobata TaxID=97700 RepID=A0A7N2MNT4_QUELO
MEKVGATEPNLEEFFEQRKRIRNPLVPIDSSFCNEMLWRLVNDRLWGFILALKYGYMMRNDFQGASRKLWGLAIWKLCQNVLTNFIKGGVSNFKVDLEGALMTAGVLTAGLVSFRRGNSQLGQVLMRARVVAQGATVALMVGTAYYYGESPWGSK